MVHKRGSKSGEGLTKTQSEVYHYIANEFLTPKQISIRRQTSVRAVYKTLKTLRVLGVLDKQFLQVHKNQSSLTLDTKKLRLHGEEYNIKIIYKDSKYKEIKSNTLFKEGNTIRLYNNSVEIYSGQSFFGDTTNEAESKGNIYWKRFIPRLEQELKIILVKDGKYNINRVNYHYSETNNELAKDYEKKSQKLNIQAKEDKKRWLTIDNSFNMHELETTHPNTAKPDMDNIKKHFNDIRDNSPPTNTEMMKFLIQERTLFAKDLREHNKLLKNINRAANKLNKIEKQKEKYKADREQKSLGKWV